VAEVAAGLRPFTLLLLLIVAGMTAAHIAHNSDVWLHLATGRDFVSGKYSLGHDPYSYTGADRYWVNANWLTDIVSYQIWKQSPSGSTLVLLKAILFAGRLPSYSGSASRTPPRGPGA